MARGIAIGQLFQGSDRKKGVDVALSDIKGDDVQGPYVRFTVKKIEQEVGEAAV
jgi:hypothetical protein